LAIALAFLSMRHGAEDRLSTLMFKAR